VLVCFGVGLGFQPLNSTKQQTQTQTVNITTKQSNREQQQQQQTNKSCFSLFVINVVVAKLKTVLV